jgi:hypothetical protein
MPKESAIGSGKLKLKIKLKYEKRGKNFRITVRPKKRTATERTATGTCVRLVCQMSERKFFIKPTRFNLGAQNVIIKQLKRGNFSCKK